MQRRARALVLAVSSGIAGCASAHQEAHAHHVASAHGSARPHGAACATNVAGHDAPPEDVRGLANIQRSLRRLAESRADAKQALRVLFYGQSITESGWSREIESMLRRRYPEAELEVEHRALGGFAAQLLVKTAETDLYPFYPDLVILHVTGDHRRYEDMIRRARERTTAEFLIQTDHILTPAELDEETDPARLEPHGALHGAFMNQRFLPSLVERYQVTLCDQRSSWKRRLRAQQLDPAALLSDGVHLNERGDAWMAEIVARCLTRRAELDPAPAEAWVTTRALAQPGAADTLTLEFEGNRIDAITHPRRGTAVNVRIDGKPPSEHGAIYAFTRALTDSAGKWPVVFDLSSEAPRVREELALEVRRVGTDPARYAFTLTSSLSGHEGEGRSDARFVSRSRRVVIEPDDWTVAYAFELARKVEPERFTVRFRAEPHGSDVFSASEGDADREHAVTIAQGLENGPHTLELRGDLASVAAVRVYRPPLARK